ncbi:flavodoxin family protein [Candidatus Harpocratesius sp.]
MKKAVVLYNSRTGNTEKVAKKISEGLEADCFNHKHIPNLQNYDLVVIGSWVLAGHISFAGWHYMKKLYKKKLAGKKVALFFTSGAPEDIDPTSDKEHPLQIKDVMFNRMEKLLKKRNDICILENRFYTLGEVHINKNKPPKGALGHPNSEDLDRAKNFGESLKQYL